MCGKGVGNSVAMKICSEKIPDFTRRCARRGYKVFKWLDEWKENFLVEQAASTSLGTSQQLA